MNPVNDCPCRKASGGGNPLTFTIRKIISLDTHSVNNNGSLHFFIPANFNFPAISFIRQNSTNLKLIFNNIYIFPKGE